MTRSTDVMTNLREDLALIAIAASEPGSPMRLAAFGQFADQVLALARDHRRLQCLVGLKPSKTDWMPRVVQELTESARAAKRPGNPAGGVAMGFHAFRVLTMVQDHHELQAQHLADKRRAASA